MQSQDNREPNERLNLIQNLAEKIKTAEDPQKVLSQWVGSVMNEGPQKVLSRWFVQVGYRARSHVGLITLVLALAAVVIVWSFPNDGIAEELRGEITGIAITLILVDRLLSIRTRVEHEKELLEQLRSPVRDIAVEALRLVRKDEHLFPSSKNFFYVKWSGADLTRADLSDAILSDADLSSASLFNANLGDANLSYAILSDAILYDADLSGANLSDAILSGADLREADLREADLRGAQYNNRTKWPEGFDPIAAGAVLVEEQQPTPNP